MTFDIYTDGGLVEKSPSRIGGAWAYVIVDDRGPVRQAAGPILPAEFGLDFLSCNVAEFCGILHALESVPHPECLGTVNSDSNCAILWWRAAVKPKALPQTLWERSRVELKRLRTPRLWVPTFRLLAGHPTRAELAAGVAARNGNPVSRHNVLADTLARRACDELLATRARGPAVPTPVTILPPCPRDTNGDGNCGRRYCTRCNPVV